MFLIPEETIYENEEDDFDEKQEQDEIISK